MLLSLAAACDKVPLAGADRFGHHAFLPPRIRCRSTARLRSSRTSSRTGRPPTPPTTPGTGTPGTGTPGTGTPTPGAGTTTTTSNGAGTPVQNGTLVTFTTTIGRIEPSEARTSNGQVRREVHRRRAERHGHDYCVLRRRVGQARELRSVRRAWSASSSARARKRSGLAAAQPRSPRALRMCRAPVFPGSR